MRSPSIIGRPCWSALVVALFSASYLLAQPSPQHPGSTVRPSPIEAATPFAPSTAPRTAGEPSAKGPIVAAPASPREPRQPPAFSATVPPEEPLPPPPQESPASSGHPVLGLLVVLTAVCGAGYLFYLWFYKRLVDLDLRLSRLKEHLARLADENTRLAARPEPAVRPPSLTKEEVRAIVSEVVERSVSGLRGALAAVEARAQRTAQEVTDLGSTVGDEIPRRIGSLDARLELFERSARFDETARVANDPAAPRKADPAPAEPVDPLVALARALIGSQEPQAAPSGAPAIATKLAHELGHATRPLNLLEGASRDPSVPLGSEAQALAQRIAEFKRLVFSAAGLPQGAMAPQIPRFAEYLAKGSPGVASFDASPPRAAEQGPGTAVPGSTCTPARALLGYLDWAVGSTRGAGSGDPDALAAATPEGFLSHVFSLVDATHDLRSRLQTSGPQGPPASAQELVESLDTLFDSFRELLRGHGITVVAPEPGRPLDPSTSRVAESVVRRDVPGETVVRVIRCGFKNALTGQVLRLAEVITAS